MSLEFKAPPEFRTLIRALACQDGVFTPPRRCSEPSWPWRWQTIRDYRKAGMAFAAGGGDEASQKAAERSLTTLADAALVRRIKPRGANATRLKLIERGDQIGRALCGLPGLRNAIGRLREMHEYRTHPESSVVPAENCGDESRPLIPEWLFTPSGQRWGKATIDDLYAAGDLMRFCWVRGWVRFNCDAERRCWVWLSPEGLEIATGKRQPPNEVADLPDEIPGALELYDLEMNAALRRLNSTTEISADVGPTPLSCSILTKAANVRLSRGAK